MNDREEFEAEIVKHFAFDPALFKQFDGNSYFSDPLTFAFIGWKAARATPAQPTEKPLAWLATDLDGHGDVAFTQEEAKRRAGESCTYFYPLYDTDKPQPSPSSVGAAIRNIPLPEPEKYKAFGDMVLSSWEKDIFARGALAMRSEAAALAEQQRPFCPTQQQFQEWCERHDMRADRGDVREAFDDAASLYLTAQDGQKSEGGHG